MWWWDPFEDFDEMFERLWPWTRPRRHLLTHRKTKKGEVMPYRTPVTDLYETEKSVIATMELPGVNKEDIELNVTNDRIEVKVEQKAEAEEEDKEKGYYRYESRCKSFYRSLPLPTEVEADKAQATYKDGVLRIEIPKKEVKEEKKKRIEVK